MTDSPYSQFKVWWIPQIPGQPFEVSCGTHLDRAEWLTDVLANYDLFQYENRIKPDYANAGGVCGFQDGEWVDIDEDELAELQGRL